MIVALVPDLMDRSKVLAVAPEARIVSSVDEAVAWAGPGTTVVVDLARAGDRIGDVVATGARVVAFGSHVDRDRLAAARAAGCAEVLPRSAFFSRVADLLA